MTGRPPVGMPARALGVDTLVTVGRSCDGTPVAYVPSSNAWICHLDGTLSAPYWVPTSSATLVPGTRGLLRPATAELVTSAVLALSVPAMTASRSDGEGRFTVNAPAPGWVFIDRSWWPTWQTLVDGRVADVRSGPGGILVPVSSGSHMIEQRWLPWDVWLGLGVGVLALLIAALWLAGTDGLVVAWLRRVIPSLRRRAALLEPGGS